MKIMGENSKKIHLMEQGSDSWKEIRMGKVTGTGFQKVLAKGQGKTRKAYMMQLAAERLTGLCQESYSNATMDRGNEVEPQAKACYEAINGVSVVEVGFAQLNDDIGVSPDGFVGEDGIIEIKCPNSTTHIDYILSNKMPSTYKAQVQGILWVTDRKWCDFVSFDPRMKTCRFHCVRVHRDTSYILDISNEVAKFLEELNELTEKITGLEPF